MSRFRVREGISHDRFRRKSSSIPHGQQ
ncbi:hypothetical protein EC01288_4841, partial [Escherichia coli 0.1288]